MVQVDDDSSSSSSSDSDSSESDEKKAKKSKKKQKTKKDSKKKVKRLAKKAKKAQKKAAKEAKKTAQKIKKMEEKAKKAQEKALQKSQQAVEAARRKPIELARQAVPPDAKSPERGNRGKLEESPGHHSEKRPPKRRRSSSSSSAPSQSEAGAQPSPRLPSLLPSPAPSPSPSPVPSPSPSPSISSSDDEDRDVHVGFKCASCGMAPINGPRFQCATIKDLNLCRRCYKRRDKVYPRGHKFFAMKVVPSRQVEKTTSEATNLARTQQVKNAVSSLSSAKDSELQHPPKSKDVWDVDRGTIVDEEGEVCFIRHAQALHNVSKAHLGTRDNPLTDEGLNECRKMRKEWAAEVFGAAELIVVSPLRRALQTAFELNGQDSDRRFFITALCTERWSGRCDEGNRKSQLLHEYPWLSTWQGVEELAEIWWPMQRENEIQRVNKFLSFLRGRPERKIVVVSHGGLLAHIVGYKMTNTDHHEMKLGALKPISAATKRRGKPLTPEGQCALCLTIGFEPVSGAVCRYLRDDFTFGGCGQGLCWTCMGKATSEIRVTKEQWSSLGDRAWWMHEKCMTSSDKEEFKRAMQGATARIPQPANNSLLRQESLTFV